MTRPRRRHWPRFAAAGAVAAVWMLVLPGQARAAGDCQHSSPCVIVTVVGDGAPTDQEFSLQQIDDWSLAGPQGNALNYGLRNARGQVGSLNVPQAESLNDLIDQHVDGPDGKPLPLGSVSYAEVTATGSTVTSTLANADLQPAPNPQFEGGQRIPAVYAALDGGMGYVRPLRSSTDVNASENFDTAGSVTITLHTSGRLLDVTLHGPATVSKGKPASFQATADGTGTLTWDWDFVDGPATTTGPASSTESHSWSLPGTYYVSVTVHDGSGDEGRSNFVPVTVLCADGSTPPCGPTPPGGNDPGTGQHHHHHRRRPPTGPVTGGGHDQGGHRHGTNPHHTTTTGPSSPSGPSGPTGTRGPSATTTSQTGGGRTHQQSHQRGTAGGTEVAGLLLQDTGTEAAPTPDLAVQQATAAAPVPRHVWSWPWRWAGVLVVPLLIGLGMVGESLPLRRGLTRMRS